MYLIGKSQLKDKSNAYFFFMLNKFENCFTSDSNILVEKVKLDILGACVCKNTYKGQI